MRKGPVIAIFFGFVLLLAFSNESPGQEGFFISPGGQLNSSFILNQNNYADPGGLEPSYRLTAGTTVALRTGYNFLPDWGVTLDGGRTWCGQNYRDSDKRGQHEKEVSLSYYFVQAGFRYNPILRRNRYKSVQRIRLEINGGIRLSYLSHAAVTYRIDDEKVGYPFPNPLVGYVPVTDDSSLFQKYEVGMYAKAGINWYMTERIFLSPGVHMYAGLNDMNDELYREHEGYGSSRNFQLGLDISMGFYLSTK